MIIFLIGDRNDCWDNGVLLPFMEHPDGIYLDPSGTTDDDPEGTTWVQHNFEAQSIYVREELGRMGCLEETQSKMCSPVDSFSANIGEFLANGYHELSVEIHTDVKATDIHKKLRSLTVVLRGDLLKHIHSLLHQGDLKENLKLVLDGYIPNYHGYKCSFRCAVLKPRTVTGRLRTRGDYQADHSVYIQENVDVDILGRSDRRGNTYPIPGNFVQLKVRLQLDVCYEDYLPMDSLFDQQYHKSQAAKKRGPGQLLLIANDEQQVGCSRYCHQDLLFEYCRGLRKNMIETSDWGRHKMLTFKELSRKGVDALLAFIYSRNLTVPKYSRNVAMELFSASHAYQIERLHEAMEIIFFMKRNSWFDKKMAECIIKVANRSLLMSSKTGDLLVKMRQVIEDSPKKEAQFRRKEGTIHKPTKRVSFHQPDVVVKVEPSDCEEECSNSSAFEISVNSSQDESSSDSGSDYESLIMNL